MPDEMAAAGAGRQAGPAQPADHRRRRRLRQWWLVTATALAVLLCIQPLFTGGDDAGAPSAWHPDTSPDGSWTIGTAPPTAEPDLPTATPAPTSAAPTRPPATGSTSPSRSPGQEPLGPADAAGVQDLAAKYCRQHVNGSLATPRADGGWQCVRLLVFVRAVDMDVACADAYGKGAYARNADPADAYAWRCYQR